MKKFAIAIHGGAGTILKSEMTSEKENAYNYALISCINQGLELLKTGGSALDAVELAVKALEDCPLFNAGRGSVFTHEGKHEMDASIMDGKTLNAGAVAGVLRRNGCLRPQRRGTRTPHAPRGEGPSRADAQTGRRHEKGRARRPADGSRPGRGQRSGSKGLQARQSGDAGRCRSTALPSHRRRR